MPWDFADYNDRQKASIIAMIDERLDAEKKAAAKVKK
jgi:hypothetical protein